MLTWGTRMRTDGCGSVWVGWLRHPAYGLLGLYVLPKAVTDRPPHPDRRWVRVTGLLRPLRVLALPSADPRSELAVTETPLLLHATSITPCRRDTPVPPPARQMIQVRPGRWIGRGYLAPARHFADVTCFTPSSPGARATVLEWERPYGVVRAIGSWRYLRYVLTTSAGARKHVWTNER
jgi:hypothetical protein